MPGFLLDDARSVAVLHAYRRRGKRLAYRERVVDAGCRGRGRDYSAQRAPGRRAPVCVGASGRQHLSRAFGERNHADRPLRLDRCDVDHGLDEVSLCTGLCRGSARAPRRLVAPGSFGAELAATGASSPRRGDARYQASMDHLVAYPSCAAFVHRREAGGWVRRERDASSIRSSVRGISSVAVRRDAIRLGGNAARGGLCIRCRIHPWRRKHHAIAQSLLRRPVVSDRLSAHLQVCTARDRASQCLSLRVNASRVSRNQYAFRRKPVDRISSGLASTGVGLHDQAIGNDACGVCNALRRRDANEADRVDMGRAARALPWISRVAAERCRAARRQSQGAALDLGRDIAGGMALCQRVDAHRQSCISVLQRPLSLAVLRLRKLVHQSALRGAASSVEHL